MIIDIITAFPELISAPLNQSIMQRALLSGEVEIWLHQLRHYTTDRHGKVDDVPYGGGAGMIMMAQPVFACLDALFTYRAPLQNPQRIFMSPQGKRLTQSVVDTLVRSTWLIVLCGHYKDVDARVFERDSWEEISVGDFVVSGGETPAALLVDSIVRRLPGVIGNQASADGDSFADGDLDCPYFTRPEVIEGLSVPEVLLSGHHEKIAEWRVTERSLRTRERRPDLLRTDSLKNKH